jgi:GNAT superfamily N-acetyltransferase
LEVVPFRREFEDAVVDMIVSIQRGEFDIPIRAEQQPDLRNIPSFYQTGRGGFWVALSDAAVVGSISLLDIGASQGALRKMFVRKEFRGAERGTAACLLQSLLNWCEAQAVAEIFLGTTPVLHAAHRFYEKNGFRAIEKSSLPAAFPIMEVDTMFYRLTVGER